jgi:6-phosphogluconolactonase (cycloisomerase 2 family)
MVVNRNRLLMSFSAVLLLLAACKNPYYDRVKEVVDAAKAKGNPANTINQPPTFSVPGGRIGNTDSIGMAITTPGSHIAYTLDGTDPTTDGAGTITHGVSYSAPFIPPYGTFAVKAIAYQAGWADSGVASQSYHKDLFLYSMDVSGSGMDVFSLNPATGSLSHTSTFGFPTPPGGMAINSTGTMMFVTAPGDNLIWGFTIDPLTGALTTNGTPGAALNPGAICVRSLNDALYVASPTAVNIQACAINADGSLTDLSTVTAGTATVALVSDVNSKFLYTATGSGGFIFGYTLTAAGIPAIVPGSPFAASGSPTYVTIDPTGAHLYESDDVTGSVRFWNINSVTGTLTPPYGTLYSTITAKPEKMAVDPSGKYLYVTDSTASHVVMARIAADGTLTTGGWVYPTGLQPKGVFADPSGKFVVVANSGSNSFSVFSLDPATGFLTPAGTYPSALPDPVDILITGTH